MPLIDFSCKKFAVCAGSFTVIENEKLLLRIVRYVLRWLKMKTVYTAVYTCGMLKYYPQYLPQNEPRCLLGLRYVRYVRVLFRPLSLTRVCALMRTRGWVGENIPHYPHIPQVLKTSGLKNAIYF